MTATIAQTEWVERVLGIRVHASEATTEFPAVWKRAVSDWRDASDTVDGQISALQQALRASGDGELEEIAEFGMNGVTGGFKVPLLGVLRELDPAAPNARVLDRARGVVAGFRKHLDSDERVLGCDENPFGVRVTLRATLGPALQALDAALQHAA